MPHTGVDTAASLPPFPTSQITQIGQSNSGGTLPPLGDGVDASQSQASCSISSSGSSNSGGDPRFTLLRDGDGNRDINQFSKILDVADDVPQTLAQDVGEIAYEGFKGFLDALNTVGFALPPLKAAAAGLRSVLTVIDVCGS
jgi:hypothetical protein